MIACLGSRQERSDISSEVQSTKLSAESVDGKKPARRRKSFHLTLSNIIQIFEFNQYANFSNYSSLRHAQAFCSSGLVSRTC